MVPVIEVDEKNKVVQRYSAQVTFPGDVIVMNPGVPPLGTKAFDEWLAEWHRTNNERSIVVVGEVG